MGVPQHLMKYSDLVGTTLTIFRYAPAYSLYLCASLRPSPLLAHLCSLPTIPPIPTYWWDGEILIKIRSISLCTRKTTESYIIWWRHIATGMWAISSCIMTYIMNVTISGLEVTNEWRNYVYKEWLESLVEMTYIREVTHISLVWSLYNSHLIWYDWIPMTWK